MGLKGQSESVDSATCWPVGKYKIKTGQKHCSKKLIINKYIKHKVHFLLLSVEIIVSLKNVDYVHMLRKLVHLNTTCCI